MFGILFALLPLCSPVKPISVQPIPPVAEKTENLGGAAFDLAFFSDNGLIAVAMETGRLLLWNTSSRKILKTLSFPKEQATIWKVAFDRGSRTLATAQNDGSIRLWENTQGNTWRGKLFYRDKQHIPATSIAFSPTGASCHVLAGGFMDGNTVLWALTDRSTGKTPAHLLLPKHPDYITHTLFSPFQGGMLAVTSKGPNIDLYNVSDGRSSEKQIVNITPNRSWKGHKSQVNRIAFHSMQGWAVTGSLSGELLFWYQQAGEYRPLSIPTSTKASVRAIAFDHKDLLAVGYANGMVELFSVQKAPQKDPLDTLASSDPANAPFRFALLRRFKAHRNVVSALEFSQDGMHLATCSYDKTMCLWNTNTLKQPLSSLLMGYIRW